MTPTTKDVIFIVEYKYTPTRKEPTQSVHEAVGAAFDRGESAIDTAYYFYAPALVTSKWHEAQEFVTELGGHRFLDKERTMTK